MMRNWGGIVDVTPDRSPIIAKTPVPGPVRQLRLGHRRLQGDAGLGARVRLDHRARRAASDQRAVHDRALSRRLLDRRGRGRRRGSLGAASMLLIACPYCGKRPEIEFSYGGEAHLARPRSPPQLDDQAWTDFLVHAQQHQGRVCRALAPRARLRPLLQCAARHHHRSFSRDLQDRRAASGARLATEAAAERAASASGQRGVRRALPLRRRRSRRPLAPPALHLRRQIV